MGADRNDDGWWWLRFEWQNRGGVHAHGVSRLGRDTPDTYLLAEQIIAGVIASKKDDRSNPLTLETIERGERAQHELIRFYDEIVCADSSIRFSEWLPPSRRTNNQLPMGLTYGQVEDHDQDRTDLTFVLQHHRCILGQCSKVVNGKQECRFKFPKNLQDTTKVEVVRDKLRDQTYGPYRVELTAKRINDPNIVNHNVEQLEHWRANVDCSVLHDLKKVLAYVTKYAVKPEQRSSVFSAAFNTIFAQQTDFWETRQALRRVMTRVIAERDVTVQEALHILLGSILIKFFSTI